MTEIEERPGEITEALQKPLPRTDIERTAKLYSFADLLTVLGHVSDYRHEQVSVCWQYTGSGFCSEFKTPEGAPGFVDHMTAHSRAVDFWFGVNPVDSSVTRGRGAAKDVTRLTSLCADLDVADGKCPDLDTAHAIIDEISSVLGERPCAITYSGHGLQPFWKIETESADGLSNRDAAQLVKRFGNLVDAVAAERGCKADSVFDLPRILRVPGTDNVKIPNAPVTVRCEADTGGPLTTEQIGHALDALGIDVDHRPRSKAKVANTRRLGPAVRGYDGRRFSRDALIKRVGTAPEGDRNNTLFGATKDAVRQGDLDDAMLDQLSDAGLACGLGDDEIMKTIESAAKAGGSDILKSVPGGPVWPLQNAETDAAFWAQRDILSHIRLFARSRGAAPHAVLGSVLRRAIASVDPIVQLPPTVGARASVNLFTVPVGRSGQGKDIANGVGREAVIFVSAGGVELDDPPSGYGMGSGEGLARIFKGYGKDDDEPPPSRVNLEVNEIGTLGGLADRKGATLVGELLKAWMGQPLGFSNAQRATTTYVPAHAYRLCLSVGAQPENAHFLLSRERDGLPQRFLWLPTTDPFAPPPTSEPPQAMPPARVALPVFTPIMEGEPYLIREPDDVIRVIREHRHQVNIGSDEVDPLDGHLMLTRLKVSFGLALLEGRQNISDDDWRIAGQLIAVSDQVRSRMRDMVTEGRKRLNSARAHEMADRQVLVDDRLTEERQRRVSKAILAKLDRVGQATRRELKKAVTLKIRADFDPVLEILLDNGALVRCEGGDRYELAQP